MESETFRATLFFSSPLYKLSTCHCLYFVLKHVCEIVVVISGKNVWVGLHRTGGGGFKWGATNKGPTYTSWVSSQPDNSKGVENCVQMSAAHSWHWNDIACTTTADYAGIPACEYGLLN